MSRPFPITHVRYAREWTPQPGGATSPIEPPVPSMLSGDSLLIVATGTVDLWTGQAVPLHFTADRAHTDVQEAIISVD